MKTVAIISEYNPFHNGHLYQIEKIREELGSDTAIIAIMSGNYTQRGEIAIMEKWERAKIAALCGVNLVLELPFPYSVSSAEFFARAGVSIAEKLGVVDYLSFGSECGNAEILTDIAKNMQSEDFRKNLSSLSEEKSADKLGYPALMQITYEKTYGVTVGEDLFKSNNILALEYIKALTEFQSSIIPHTIKRCGSDYSSDKIDSKSPFQSATAIRELLNSGESAENFVPIHAQNVISSETASESFPCRAIRLDSAILSKFRLSHPLDKCNVHDAEGGLYNRLIKSSLEANSISSLIDLSGTKKYTTARIRRAIWYSFFGVTSSDVKNPPEYTQVLALDNVGQALLKRIRKYGRIEVITKPSYTFGDGAVIRQKQLSDNADFIFQLSKPKANSATSIYKRSPFVIP